MRAAVAIDRPNVSRCEWLDMLALARYIVDVEVEQAAPATADADDLVAGGGGDDAFSGDPGKDTMLGNIGNDAFAARDNEADSINGGSGNDTAEVDPSLDILVSVSQA